MSNDAKLVKYIDICNCLSIIPAINLIGRITRERGLCRFYTEAYKSDTQFFKMMRSFAYIRKCPGSVYAV